MSRIVYISDFFAEDLPGGAELVDEEVITYFRQQGYDVDKIRSFETEKIEKTFKQNAVYIVSNFINLSEDVKVSLSGENYSIYEHDHKYLITRDPTLYKNSNFKAPSSAIINLNFYINAKNVFCQSKLQKEIIDKNLNTNNTINLGCSLWSDSEILSLEKALESHTKEAPAAVLDSQNSIKGQLEAEEYCKKNKIDYKLLGNLPYEEFVNNLSKFKKLVFFPLVLESFSRLAVEARILNCELVTNGNLGCASEPWFREKKGKDLLEFIKNKKLEVLERVKNSIHLTNHHCGPEPITVILNSYRRPYNLEMQIKAIREQTRQPTEIWLWVNSHEDNEGYDYSHLKIDKIFKNDHNWKFYGRFAAALLADTEYVAIFDDDTIPGSRWFENCLETIETHNGILGSAGVTLNSKFYLDHQRCGWPTQNPKTTRVDLVGHAWFFRREWLQYLWREKPATWDNGEDIQFSYLAQKYGNINTFCPPHPAEDKSFHGSILGNELGIDEKATSTNNSVSHQQFFGERDFCVQNAISGGWETVQAVKI